MIEDEKKVLQELQKQYLKTIAQQKKSYDTAQRIAHVGHWELDVSNDNLFWSDEVYRIFGLNPQELKPTYGGFLEHVHPDDRNLVNDAYLKSLRDNTPYNITHRIVTQNNDVKFVEERCEHTRDEHNNVVFSIGTVCDVTDKVLRDKELKLVYNVFRHSTDSIVITDASNLIVSVNKGFEILTGYTKAEALGKDPRILSSGWGDDKFYRKMWSDILNCGIWQGEIWDRKKNGELFIAEQTILSIKNSVGTIENYLSIGHDVTSVREREKEIVRLVNYDFLTKLPNRRLFQEELQGRINAAAYTDVKLAVMFLDLDDFKFINDIRGHKLGDEVLKKMATELQSFMEQDCILGRLGGDEFGIVCPFKDPIEISKKARTIILGMHKPFTIDDYTFNVSWSIGISTYPENGDNYEELLKKADLAMYEAKKNGKNSYAFFSDSLNIKLNERLTLDTRLKEAIKHKTFTMAYQPKISCTQGAIVGAEALIRWYDEELGNVTPDKFIPAAEESGLIVQIGDIVLEKVFENIGTLISKGLHEQTIAVNLSVHQIEQSGFVEHVSALAAKYGVVPDMVEFEITESALMKNIEFVAKTIMELKRLGYAIAIDDFGTGYSSLLYLTKLPLDTLKIDRAFVWELEKDDHAVTKAILGLSDTMGLQTVAEGVETSTQAEILKKMGCTMSQGYLFSKPVSFEEYVSLVEARTCFKQKYKIEIH